MRVFSLVLNIIGLIIASGLFGSVWAAGEWTIEDALALDTVGARFIVCMGLLLLLSYLSTLVQACTLRGAK